MALFIHIIFREQRIIFAYLKRAVLGERGLGRYSGKIVLDNIIQCIHRMITSFHYVSLSTYIDIMKQ